MTPCSEYRQHLTEHVFGDLDDAATARLREHLLSCPACRIEEEQLHVLAADARYDRFEPRPQWRARLSAAFHEANRRPRTILERRVPAWIAVAAALAGALIVAALPHAPKSVVRRAPAAEPVEFPLVQGTLPFVIAGAHDTDVRGDSVRGPRAGSDSL